MLLEGQSSVTTCENGLGPLVSLCRAGNVQILWPNEAVPEGVPGEPSRTRTRRGAPGVCVVEVLGTPRSSRVGGTAARAAVCTWGQPLYS